MKVTPSLEYTFKMTEMDSLNMDERFEITRNSLNYQFRGKRRVGRKKNRWHGNETDHVAQIP